MLPEWKVADQSPKKVRIRGKALFAFEKFFKQGVSGNQRRYILDELQRSARTLQNVPIDVNHEISAWEEKTGHNWSTYKGKKPKAKGHVMWGEEEGGELEYTAEINDPIYREKVVDTWGVSNEKMTVDEYRAKWRKPPLEGVSVDASFMHLRCKLCDDDKRYFDLKEYKDHMWNVHFIKNFEIEPRGIAFKRLSLVEPPEKPGVEGASFELVETMQGMHQIYEALLNDAKQAHPPLVQEEGNPYQSYEPEKVLTKKIENTEMKEKTETRRYAVSSDTKITFDPRASYDFTEQAEDDGPPAEVKDCPSGQHWDAETQQCVPDEADSTSTTVAEQEKCEEGTHWDEEANKCVPDAPETVKEQEECPEGMHWSAEQNTCVPNEPPHEPVPTMEVMRLGEPFADYSSFADCVAKNSDKEDPEAYCASIKTEVEETKIRRIVREELAKQTESLTEKQLREQKELQEKQREESLDAKIKQIEESIKNLGFNTAHVRAALKNVKSLQTDLTALREQNKGLGQIQKSTVDLLKTLREKQKHVHPEFKELTAAVTNISNTVTSDKHSWKHVTESLNKTVTELRQKIEDATSTLTKQVNDFTAVKPPVLTETVSLSQVAQLTEEIENLKTHLKPQFKGNSPPLSTNNVEYEDPDNPRANY